MACATASWSIENSWSIASQPLTRAFQHFCEEMKAAQVQVTSASSVVRLVSSGLFGMLSTAGDSALTPLSKLVRKIASGCRGINSVTRITECLHFKRDIESYSSSACSCSSREHTSHQQSTELTKFFRYLWIQKLWPACLSCRKYPSG